MRGYPLLSVSIFALLAVSSRSIQSSQRLYLEGEKITADRKSPAFSAIEDAFILNELVDKTKPEKKERLNLKGLKVSLNKKPLKLEKINLRGERIGVAHFTRKFIDKKNIQVAAAPKVFTSEQNVKIDRIVQRPVEMLLPEGVTLSVPKAVPGSSHVNIVAAAPEASNFLKESTVSASSQSYEVNAIAGRIELEGGGTLFGDNLSYYINRRVDGKVYESGSVDAEKGTFKMEVGSLHGILEVELRSEKGEVLAYGEHVLNKNADDFKKLNLQIYPSENLLAGRVLSSSESIEGREVPVAAAQKNIEGVQGSLAVGDEGYFNEDLFDKGSSFIVETKAQDYWSDLNFGVAGRPLYPRLIKKNVLKNFAKTIDPFGEEIEIRSAIVGSVTQQGLAQRGVEVRLFSSEYQKPVYFGPKGSADPKLTKTTTNGGFIFVNIPDGGYLVQAVGRGKILAQKWYVVKEGHISQGQLNIKQNPKMIASAESFPKGRGELRFILHELGVDEESFELSSDNESLIDTITNPEILAMRVERSEDHADHIYLTSSKTRKRRFKVVKKVWLDTFLNHRKSNANRAKGFVIGFIGQDDFRIIKETTTARSSSSQIFYFDKYGEYTEKGRAGGGFIITDVPFGLKSVVASVRGKETFLNRVIVSRPYSISIF